MMRWFNVLIFAAAGFYVRHYNATHDTSQLMFPGLQELVGGDLREAGELSWQICLGVALLLAPWATWRTARDAYERRRSRDEDTSADA